jgi:hypothetical protein
MDAELVGEVFGGTLAPAMAGGVADRYGLVGSALDRRRRGSYRNLCRYVSTRNCASQTGILG